MNGRMVLRERIILPWLADVATYVVKLLSHAQPGRSGGTQVELFIFEFADAFYQMRLRKGGATLRMRQGSRRMARLHLCRVWARMRTDPAGQNRSCSGQVGACHDGANGSQAPGLCGRPHLRSLWPRRALKGEEVCRHPGLVGRTRLPVQLEKGPERAKPSSGSAQRSSSRNGAWPFSSRNAAQPRSSRSCAA